MHFDAGEKREQKSGPARGEALMRRFSGTGEGEQMAVPRACTDVAASPEPASVKDGAGIAPAPTGAAPKQQSSEEAQRCHPKRAFVERLCAGNHPGVALIMFGAGSPWDRAYLLGESKAWTTAPGAQDQDRLMREEEIIVLQGAGPEQGGVQVISSAGASFYALRWNGSCVKLTDEEITRKVPWHKGHTPPLDWNALDDNLQETLRKDEKIDAGVIAQRKECRGARLGAQSPACAKLTRKLNELIVAHVRSGAPLPDPTNLP